MPFHSSQMTTSAHLSRGNGSSTERGFSNPQEYADKNVRAPLDSELRALRGENFLAYLIAVRSR
jgi:hypothetical protein